jgi:hypothetical protein
MKINIAEIAEQLRKKGFTILDIDSDDLTDAVIELLDEKELFVELSEEMEKLEDQERNVETELEYLEKIGEV